MESPSHHRVGFAAWVSGWSTLVGALALVVPLYFFFGSSAALYGGAAVLLTSGLLAWLSSEVSAALQADSGAQETVTGDARASSAASR